MIQCSPPYPNPQQTTFTAMRAVDFWRNFRHYITLLFIPPGIRLPLFRDSDLRFGDLLRPLNVFWSASGRYFIFTKHRCHRNYLSDGILVANCSISGALFQTGSSHNSVKEGTPLFHIKQLWMIMSPRPLKTKYFRVRRWRVRRE